MDGGSGDTIVHPIFAQLDQAAAGADTRLGTIAGQFHTDTAGIIADMAGQTDRATANLAAARETLSGDFDILLSDLGSPDPASREGLLGKLREIAAQVGDTATVLSALVRTTNDYANTRSADVREANLQAAEFAAAQAKVAGFAAFAGAPEGVDVTTVFTFTLGG
jgi:hypothetical protein